MVATALKDKSEERGKEEGGGEQGRRPREEKVELELGVVVGTGTVGLSMTDQIRTEVEVLSQKNCHKCSTSTSCRHWDRARTGLFCCLTLLGSVLPALGGASQRMCVRD